MNRYESVVLAASILACAPAVDAQQAGSTPPITVTEEAKTLDTIVVVGRDPKRLPGSITTIDAETLRDANRQIDLSEVLPRVPGFTALDRRNQAQDLQIQSRGFGARSTFGIRGIRLIVDGIPATAADGQSQAAAFPMSALDRVDVLRGPLALQQGNAAGGVIVGESVLDGLPGFALEGWWANDESSRAMLRVDGGDENDVFRWRAAASFYDTAGARAHSAARRKQINGIATWADRADGQWKAVINWLEQPLAEDPLGLTREVYARTPFATDPSALSFNTRKTVGERQLGLQWRRAIHDDGAVWISAHNIQRDVEQFLALPTAAQLAPGSAGGVIDLHRDSWGLDAGYRWRGSKGMLTIGLEALQLEEARRGYENFIGQRLGVRGRIRRDEDNRVDALDAWISGEYEFDAYWSVLGAVRGSWRSFVSRDHYIAPSNGNDSGNARNRNNALSFGMLRKFDFGQIFASYGHGFETPTLNEQAYRPDGESGFNHELRAAAASTIEIGSRWRSARAGGSVAIYRIDGRDEIVPAVNRGGRASFANAGATQREGVELGLDGQLGPQWSYLLTANWIRARFTEEFVFQTGSGAQAVVRRVAAGNRIPGVPRGEIFAELKWRSLDTHWSSAIEAHWTGSIAVDDRNTDATAHNLRIALRGRWQPAADSAWHGFVRIDNLFDREYVGSIIVNETNGRYFEPGAGRNLTVGVGWSRRR